jgi:hypothetical protein
MPAFLISFEDFACVRYVRDTFEWCEFIEGCKTQKQQLQWNQYIEALRIPLPPPLFYAQAMRDFSVGSPRAWSAEIRHARD